MTLKPDTDALLARAEIELLGNPLTEVVVTIQRLEARLEDLRPGKAQYEFASQMLALAKAEAVGRMMVR